MLRRGRLVTSLVPAKPQRRTKELLRKRLKAHLADYCRNTTIHGLRYVGEERRPLAERLVWIVAFLLSLLACLYLMGQAWTKWQQSPVIVSLDEKLRPIWELPFPAVTICPETRVRTDVYNYTDMHHRERRKNLSEEELRVYSDVSLMCSPHLFPKGNLTTDNSIIDLIDKLAPQFKRMLMQSRWHGKGSDPAQLFQPLLTEEGLCYTFNMLDGAELFPSNTFHGSGRYLNYSQSTQGWTLDRGYSPGAGVDAYPYRALGAGAGAGLFVMLSLLNTQLDYLCRGPGQGFKIQLHSPADFPRVGQQYFRVPLNQEVVVAVSPVVFSTSPELAHYLPQVRHCYFPAERRLRFFRVYTQQNCAFECLTNYTLQACGCVAFHMPRELDTPICGSGSTKCVINATEALLVHEVEQGLRTDAGGPNCQCLQACTALQYQVERSQADVDWHRMMQAFGEDVKLFKNHNLVRVFIFFKDTHFMAIRRRELFGQTDFLANCGGLLGLTMGISVLSLVEIFYWLALRVFCPTRTRQPELQK